MNNGLVHPGIPTDPPQCKSVRDLAVSHVHAMRMYIDVTNLPVKEEGSYRVSPLAADMLEAFLRADIGSDGDRISPELKMKIQAALASSKTMKLFEQQLKVALGSQIKEFIYQQQRDPSAGELQKMAAKTVDEYREAELDPVSREPRRIYFDKDGLQPVIGGVEPPQVMGARLVRKGGGGAAGDLSTITVLVRFADTYNFTNNRKFVAEYDEFRKALAGELQAGHADKFFRMYDEKWQQFMRGQSKLYLTQLVGSYMYAYQQGGCEHGKPMRWEVDVPITFTLVLPPPGRSGDPEKLPPLKPFQPQPARDDQP